MRHLTTEELLLHCDGALATELAVHVEECSVCRDKRLRLQAVLFEAQMALRASVPAEPAAHKAASRRNLERALYPPKTHGFPLRWSVVYSAAAALTMMVAGGYLTNREAPETTPQIAAVPSPAAVRQPKVAQPIRAAVPDIVAEQVPRAPVEPATDMAADLGAELMLATDPHPREPEGDSSASVEPERFELEALSRPQAVPQQLAWLEPPNVSASLVDLPVALIPDQPVATFRTVVEEAGPAPPSDPTVFAHVIEGYWLLAQAKVWEQDLHPVWTPRGLLIEGTVEDAEVREHVRLAVLRHATEPPAFQIRLREESPANQPAARPSMARVVHAADSGSNGGAVRRSLLTHFSDAARRSFVAPQPSALEAELVRYVSEVYSNQSELLSHAYALDRFLGRMDADYLASASPQTTRRFRDLVRFHLGALDEREAAIYDRLSEALPRKVWSHRGNASESADVLDWWQESQGLLQDTLELDSSLTALFGSSSMTVDVSNPELSCGELLNRIRTRIRRIKNRTQAL